MIILSYTFPLSIMVLHFLFKKFVSLTDPYSLLNYVILPMVFLCFPYYLFWTIN